MTDSRPTGFAPHLRAAAAEFLTNHREEIEAQWRGRLTESAIAEAISEPILSRLIGFFPSLIEVIRGDGSRAAGELSELAAAAHDREVRYVLLSRGLRVLKRYLMSLLVANLPSGAERDAICDLIEEEIDESRVLVNQFYHTLHETRLRRSEALTRFLLNNTYDAIFVVELDSRQVEQANAIAIELTGYPRDQLQGLQVSALVPPHRAKELDDALARLEVSGTFGFEEMPLITAAGEAIPARMHLVAVRTDTSRRLAQITVRDTRAEAAAVTAQETETAYLRAFVTDTADAVLVIDLARRIRSWNNAAAQIFGYTADEILNRPVTVLMPDDVVAREEDERLDRTVEERGFIRNVETVRKTKDGRRIDVEITRTAIFDPLSGRMIGTSAVVRDVTEKKRFERIAQRKAQQLEIMNRILEATSRSLDRDQTFRTIASQMEGLLPCDALTVCLPETDVERLRCRVLISDEAFNAGSELYLSRGETLHGRGLIGQESFRIDDLSALPEAGSDDRRLIEQGYRSALVSPLIYNQEAMGTLMLLHREVGKYNEQDQAQLDHLANHFAVILENARRYESERKRAAQFELISRVGAAAIANIGDVRRLMRSVVETIQTDFGYYDVAIYTVEEDVGVFRLLAQAGHRRGALGEGFEQSLEAGVFGEVLRTQGSYVANDIYDDPLYVNPTPRDSNIRSELCVPIRLGPRVFGVLDVESQRANRFDRLDQAAMEALAGLLARCMEADESLRQTRMLQAMRHNIMEAVPSALLLLDDQLRVRFVNRRYCEFFGQRVDEIMNRHATEILPPMLLEESNFLSLVEQLKQTHRAIDQREVRYFDFNQTERYADVRLRIVTEYETNIIVMLHDATNRLKRLYQLTMLQEIGEEMQRTLDSDRLLQAILTCVTAGPGFGFNRASLFLLDRDRQQLVERLRVGPRTAEEAGEVWHQLGHKRSIREFLREYDSLHGTTPRRPPEREPVVISTAEEDEQLRRWRTPLMLRGEEADRSLAVARELLVFSGASEILVVPLVSQESVLGLIVADNMFSSEPISRDSIRMLSTFANQAGVALANAQAFEQLENTVLELRETQDELRRAERLAGIGSVAAHVAHEIRNPLVSIGGFARRVEQRADDAEYVKKRSGIILREVQRLEQILRNVADFTAPGAPQLAPTDLNQVVRNVLSVQQPVFEESDTQVDARLADELPGVMADGDKLTQVLLNLVRNGVQAMGDGGRLEVITQGSPDGNAAEIVVRDNGPGIPAERVEEIFNPFFTSKADGTGLGLAVSRKIVVDHGGELLVDSRPGEGATFRIRLPLAPES